MGVITISREYGSGGRKVALDVAHGMEYICMDKELIVEVARKAKVPVSEVERFDEQTEHPALRALKMFLTPGHPDAMTGFAEYEWWTAVTVPELTTQREQALAILDEEAYVKLTKEVILRLADEGDVVLVGRGSQALLRDRPDALHVRIIAPLECRIQTVIERDKLSQEESTRRIRKIDEQRRRYVKRHYSLTWDAPNLYHLTVNTGLTGLRAAVVSIIEVANHLPITAI